MYAYIKAQWCTRFVNEMCWVKSSTEWQTFCVCDIYHSVNGKLTVGWIVECHNFHILHCNFFSLLPYSFMYTAFNALYTRAHVKTTTTMKNDEPTCNFNTIKIQCCMSVVSVFSSADCLFVVIIEYSPKYSVNSEQRANPGPDNVILSSICSKFDIN